MRPLKKLYLVEGKVDDRDTEHGERGWWTPLHITRDVFDAICKKHSSTIQRMTIDCDDDFNSIVSPPMLTPFLTKATSPKTLTLDVRDCDIDFVEHLPPSLQILTLAP
jgi:hypothetical protein